ncbi:TIGR03086 family protein [Streptomyces sp. JJ66]|uniref:TIGR03086 family metal-binding protein n=1 Tax=Streptomyces sp. JJ66 TaxID=2803843 RepID=UPI001C56C2CB|nr:TIGR03086 family metal-binding protein [Streptomyces sp. JJ66]MBW1603332.1 TIGR03086 family protein [Streptomyces sp. JJ66]
MTDAPPLAPQARHVAALLPGIDDDQLTARTPCPRYTVADLLQHLVVLTEAFADAAAKRRTALTTTSPEDAGPALAEDWRTRLPAQLTTLAEAWRGPQAWRGDTQVGGVELPGAEAGRVALNELLIHGWDLARATDQPYAADPVAVQASFSFLDGWDGGTEDGLFGPRVPVPDSAPLLDRVIGLSGRDPAWPGLTR